MDFNRKCSENYCLGLDVGTASVGYCVIDENGKLFKINRKGDNGNNKRNSLWGVRTFKSGEPAKGCRINRSTRRRYSRTHTRILELRKIMSDMVCKVDENFFARLDESFLWKEDKSDKAKSDYILFADKDCTDKDYYEKYQTIYHLRKHLLGTTEKADARFIYLALHHMLKYRGNFLYEGQKFTELDDFKIIYEQFLTSLKEYLEIECNYDQISCEEIEKKLKEKKSKKEKYNEVSEILKKLGLDKKYAEAVANAIIGYKFNVATIINDKNLCDENGKEMSVSFASADYEEEEQKLSDELGEKFSVIENLKRLYSWYVIKQIMQGSDKNRVNYLSEAMVAKYEKHHAELKELKELFRDYKTQKEYSEFFHKELKAEQKDGKMSPAFLKSFGKIKKGEYVPNYANYIKGMKRCGDTQSKARENLYKCIKALLGDVAKDDERYIRICAEMENDSYLEKINDVSNSVIPYQLNEMEMEKILDIQGEFYPELKKNKELILKMLTSKIPYFVGPLNPGSRFAWMSKKAGMENKSVYPWNVEEVVDVDKTAEKFITRMTNYCTYLPCEKVLPKHSIIYQWYEVLTELSQISIDKIKFGKEIRDDIIQNLFLKKVSVSGNNLKEHLKKSGTYNDIDNRVIKGYQGGDNFASSMSSYITFKKIFGEINMSNIDMIEQIIYWLTIFDDKKIIKRKIEQNYKDKINDSQLKRILKIKYTGWGQLSKKFLTGIKGDTGHTIIEMLEEGDPRWKELPNLIQIINRDEKIKTVIEENRLRYNGEDDLPDIIDKLHTSPANKRGIKQCMKVIEEIIEYMGRKPEQIFIEFAREEGEKVETKKVKDKLDKAIGKLKQEFKDYYNDDIKQELKDNEKRLDEEKVRLYFSQNGKSLYSAPSAGNQLSLDNLNQYDVDHIIPYSISQDDSMDNKVLVEKIENQNKGNRIVSDAFGNKADYKEMQNYWEMLYKAGLISEKKYNNLNKSLDEVFSKGFINRQLVETRQIVKNVANLISDYYDDKIEVIEVKAQLSSYIRNKFTQEKKDDDGFWIENTENAMFFKNRGLNDYHHAHDAYLACIIGLYIQKVYPGWKNELNFKKYRREFEKYYEEQKKYNTKSKKEIYISMLSRFTKNYEKAGWNGEEIIEYMRKIFCYRDVMISKKTEENTGSFYNQTRYPKEKLDGNKKETKLIPLKSGNNLRGKEGLKELSVEKYGGYQGGECAYFVLVKYYTVKKKKKTEEKQWKMEFVGIPTYISYEINKGNINLKQYVCDKLKNDTIEILRGKICKYQELMDEEGNRYFLVGPTEVANAKQFVLGSRYQKFNRLYSYINSENWHYIRTDELEKEIDEFFKLLQNKIHNEFKGYIKDIDKVIGANTSKLDIDKKIDYFNEIYKIVQANSSRPSVSKFNIAGISDGLGRKRSLPFKDKIIIVDKSVTGIYERRTCFELENGGNTKSC